MLQQGKMIAFNVYVYYAKVIKPALKFGKKPVKGKPHANREYAVDVLFSQEDYSEMKKRYKTVKSVKEAAEYTAKEFEEKYNMAPPFEDESYYIIKFKKSADYKDGNAAEKPTIGAMKTCKVKLTPSTELGNGTKAHVAWREREWNYDGKKGLSLDLKSLAVVDLVEYSRNAGAEFGEDFVAIEDDGSYSAGDESDFGDDYEEVEGESEEETSETSDDGDDSDSW